ncbi:MAG: homoserine kinase [Galactobacter sp.]
MTAVVPELTGLVKVPGGTTPLLGADVSVHVPATSANLGPGYDTLGLALGYGDDLTTRIVAGTGLATVRITGQGSDCLPTDGTHLAARTIRLAWDAWGVDHSQVDLELTAVNRIPHGRGQGSSSAVIVAAVATAAATLPQELVLRPGRDDVFELAARLEGHPDNVAPTVYGGLTIAWEQSDEHRRFRVALPTPHSGVVPIVAVPDVILSTEVARGLLPAEVPHADAAANAAAAALMVHALTHEPALLPSAARDRLHEGYRAPAMPHTARLIEQARSEGFAATVSGAGPTALILVEASQREEALTLLGRLTEHSDVTWTVSAPGIDTSGVTVEVHRPVA